MLRVASAQNICFNFSCLAETGLKLAPAQELKIEREKKIPPVDSQHATTLLLIFPLTACETSAKVLWINYLF